MFVISNKWVCQKLHVAWSIQACDQTIFKGQAEIP